MPSVPTVPTTEYADVSLMRLLVEAKADVKLGLNNGITPLMAAAGLGMGDRITRRGVDYPPGAMTPDGGKAPAVKAKEEAEAHEAVALLIDLGADVNERDADGNTALFGAATEGYNSVVGLLAEKGANLSARNRNGKTPLSAIAARSAAGKKTTSDLSSTAESLRSLGAEE